MKSRQKHVEKSKILIVDDIKVNIRALKIALIDLDATVLEATSGQEALTILSETDVALVLLDVSMPGMDGFQTAECIRENKYAEAVPIIFVTAIDKDKNNIDEGYKCGAVDYLFKPVDVALLKSKVQVFLDIDYQKKERIGALLRELQVAKSDLEKSNARLEFIASRDLLTGLPNRSEFLADLIKNTSGFDAIDSVFSIILIDIDSFKSTNDCYGHSVGDELLVGACKLITENTSNNDLLYRLGGDEFALVLSETKTHQDAVVVASQLHSIFQSPLKVRDHDLHVSLSMGLASYPEAGKDSQEMMKSIDYSLYRAKCSGKNTWVSFDEKISKEHKKAAEIEKALREKMYLDEFEMHYQTISDLESLKPIGTEALLRWKHPKLGQISPVDFIPVAEDIGLMNDIGLWVIESSLSQISAWLKEGFVDLNYAINLSPKQLQNPTFYKFFHETLIAKNIDPRCLTLELTETAVTGNAIEGGESLEKLSNLGVKISIDDFGTGYSSLLRLRELPISTIKIDKSFVSELESSRNDAVIVKVILYLAESLNLEVVAEGIENKYQLEQLKKYGCKSGQGYLLSKPSNAAATTETLKRARL